MALEIATYISGLNASNPAGSDPLAQADDHLRLIKSTIKNTFPNINGEVSLTDETINALPNRVLALEEGGIGAIGGGTVTFPETLPEAGEYEGELAFVDGVLYSWDGSEWLVVSDTVTTPDAPDAVLVVDELPEDAEDGSVALLRSDNKLYKKTNGVWAELELVVAAAEEVANGSITTAKFAQGITPLEIVSALPTTNNFEGRLVYRTTDDKIYRYTGTSWTAGTATSDLTGTIGADLIEANAITAGKIAAGAVSATEIASGAISADKIAAGAITTEKLAAVAITAEKIATNAITSDKITASAITSAKISAGAIGTTQLAASAITSDKMAANSITAANAAISNAAVTTLKIAGNAVTQAVSASSSSDTSCGTSFTTVLSLSITTSGTQPIYVDVSAFVGGAFNGTFNTAKNTAIAQVSLAGQTKAVVPFQTIYPGDLAASAGSALFTGVSAGTYTATLQFQATDTSGNAPGINVRNPSMIIIETKR
jgi:hypothetical protein